LASEIGLPAGLALKVLGTNRAAEIAALANSSKNTRQLT
jgi:hypothetical protein